MKMTLSKEELVEILKGNGLYLSIGSTLGNYVPVDIRYDFGDTYTITFEQRLKEPPPLPPILLPQFQDHVPTSQFQQGQIDQSQEPI